MFDEKFVETLGKMYDEESELDFDSGNLDVDVNCDLGEEEEIVQKFAQPYF